MSEYDFKELYEYIKDTKNNSDMFVSCIVNYGNNFNIINTFLDIDTMSFVKGHSIDDTVVTDSICFSIGDSDISVKRPWFINYDYKVLNSGDTQSVVETYTLLYNEDDYIEHSSSGCTKGFVVTFLIYDYSKDDDIDIVKIGSKPVYKL